MADSGSARTSCAQMVRRVRTVLTKTCRWVLSTLTRHKNAMLATINAVVIVDVGGKV